MPDDRPDRPKVPTGTWRHFKGNDYVIVDFEWEEASEGWLVVYASLAEPNRTHRRFLNDGGITELDAWNDYLHPDGSKCSAYALYHLRCEEPGKHRDQVVQPRFRHLEGAGE